MTVHASYLLAAALTGVQVTAAMAQSPQNIDLIITHHSSFAAPLSIAQVNSSAYLGSFRSPNQCWAALQTHLSLTADVKNAYCRNAFGEAVISCDRGAKGLVCTNAPKDPERALVSFSQVSNWTKNWEIFGDANYVYFGREVNEGNKTISYSYYYKSASRELCRVSLSGANRVDKCKPEADLIPNSEAQQLAAVARSARDVFLQKRDFGALRSALNLHAATAWAQRNYDIALN
jgi:hypothetical protein